MFNLYLNLLLIMVTYVSHIVSRGGGGGRVYLSLVFIAKLSGQ